MREAQIDVQTDELSTEYGLIARSDDIEELIRIANDLALNVMIVSSAGYGTGDHR